MIAILAVRGAPTAISRVVVAQPSDVPEVGAINGTTGGPDAPAAALWMCAALAAAIPDTFNV